MRQSRLELSRVGSDSCVRARARPAAAVSRCVVQFMLSSLIPSAQGALQMAQKSKKKEKKEESVGMRERIKTPSAPTGINSGRGETLWRASY